MPAKSGASHAFAAFLSIIIGSMISNFLSAHGGILNSTSEGVGAVVTGITGVSMSEEVTGLLVISSFLAFLWGVAYHFAQTGTGTEESEANNFTADTPGSKTTQHVQGNSLEEKHSNPAGQRIGPTYRTLSDAQSADETLRSKLQRDFAEVKSQLDDVHDGLYDSGERERAGEVLDLVDTITTLEQTVTRGEWRIGSQARGTSDPDEPKALATEAQQTLFVTHHRLIDAVDELVDAVEELARRPTDVRVETLEDCEVVLRECKRTLSRRDDTIEKLGETQ